MILTCISVELRNIFNQFDFIIMGGRDVCSSFYSVELSAFAQNDDYTKYKVLTNSGNVSVVVEGYFQSFISQTGNCIKYYYNDKEWML